MDWELLHRSVVSIFDSYHAPEQDVLIEVVQNAVDAIEERAIASKAAKVKYAPEIRISLDTSKNKLEIADNGIGVPEAILQQLGSPHNTSKKTGRRRGHKGVGLTYCAWSTQKFQFATRHLGSKNVLAGVLVGAQKWVKNGGGPCPVIDKDDKFGSRLLEGPSGATFSFEFSADSRVLTTFKRLTSTGQETFLRTKTAIGHVNLPETDSAAGDDWVSKTKVSIIVDGGLPHELTGLWFRYPHLLVDAKNSANLASLGKLSQTERKRIEGKKKFLYTVWPNEKVVAFLQGSSENHELAELAKSQKLSVYVAFADQKRTIDLLNDALYSPTAGPGRKRNIVAPGIQIVTASMPVGQLVEPDLRFGTGNKNRIMAVCDFDDVRPDYGRKTFDEQVVRASNLLVEHIINKELVPERDFLVKHETAHGETLAEQEMNLESFKEAALAKVDLKLQDMGIVKEPDSEQEVSALFHALLGSRRLVGYRMLSSPGSRAKYDAFFDLHLTKAENDQLSVALRLGKDKFPAKQEKVVFKGKILEFKYRASGVVEDFEGAIKDVGDIFAVVCWEIGVNDAISAVGSIYRLADYREGPDLPGQTHVLEYHGKKLKVICLSDVITTLAAEQ